MKLRTRSEKNQEKIGREGHGLQSTAINPINSFTDEGSRATFSRKYFGIGTKRFPSILEKWVKKPKHVLNVKQIRKCIKASVTNEVNDSVAPQGTRGQKIMCLRIVNHIFFFLRKKEKNSSLSR